MRRSRPHPLASNPPPGAPPNASAAKPARRRWLAMAALGGLSFSQLGLAAALFSSGCKESKPEGPAGSQPPAESAEIVIGHYGSLTGNTAHFGQDTDKAVRLAVDEQNAQGGLLGKKIRVV